MTSPVVVNPLLPECLDETLTLDDVNAEAALAFQPNEYSYYKVGLRGIARVLQLPLHFVSFASQHVY